MKRLLFFDFIHHYGGAQRSTIDIIRHLKELGYEVGVVDPCRNLAFESALKQLQISYWTCDIEFKLDRTHKWNFLFSLCCNLWKYIYISFYFCYVCYKYRPHIVWTNSYKSFYVVLLAKMLFHYCFYFFVRGVKMDENLTTIQRFFYNLFLDKVLVQTKTIKNYLVQQRMNRHIDIIPNSISDELVSYISDSCKDYESYSSCFKILFVGTIIKEKGVEELLQALHEIVLNKLKVHLFIAGDYVNLSYKDYIQSLLLEYELDDYVSFMGWREDVRDLIFHADCVVLPSYSEGMPRSIMEGMSLGKPVIVTNVGGVIDFVEHNRTGLVISPRNVSILAKAISFLYFDLANCKRLGVNARIHIINHFSEESQRSLLLKLLK